MKIWEIIVLTMWSIYIPMHILQCIRRHYRPRKIVTYLKNRLDELENQMKEDNRFPIAEDRRLWPRYQEVWKTLEWLGEP